jgi:hypothetical protein
VLRNAKGEAFEFEYMQPLASSVVDWQRNLQKLGITMKVRLVDFALYRRRLEQYDYDMVAIVDGAFTLPQAAELAAPVRQQVFRRARQQQLPRRQEPRRRRPDRSHEPRRTMQELRDAARAFDRVVTWSFWQIPDLYSGSRTSRTGTSSASRRCMARYFRADTLITASSNTAPGRCGPGGTSGPRKDIESLSHADAYILKRIGLMMPTLLGALTVTFIVMQFVPGGPVEQILAEARAGAGARHRLQGRPRHRRQAARSPDEAIRLRQAGA